MVLWLHLSPCYMPSPCWVPFPLLHAFSPCCMPSTLVVHLLTWSFPESGMEGGEEKRNAKKNSKAFRKGHQHCGAFSPCCNILPSSHPLQCHGGSWKVAWHHGISGHKIEIEKELKKE